MKAPIPPWLGPDTPELRDKLQDFIDALGRDQLIGELRASYRLIGTLQDDKKRLWDALNSLVMMEVNRYAFASERNDEFKKARALIEEIRA